MIDELKDNFNLLLGTASKLISHKTTYVLESSTVEWEKKDLELEKIARAAFALGHYDAQYCLDSIVVWINDIENHDHYRMIVDNRVGKDGTSMKDCYSLLCLSFSAKIITALFEGTLEDIRKGKFGFAVETLLFKLMDKYAISKQKLATTQFFFKNIVKLLVVLLDSRFTAVSDRLLTTMKSNSATIDKICKFLRQVTIKYYPTDKLEESADFLKSMCDLFFQVSEHPFKKILSDTIIRLLLPAIHLLKAELKVPVWSNFVDDVLSKLLKFLSKSKYASYNFPLCVHILCVSPEPKFLQHYMQLLEIGLKYKDVSTRNQAIYYSNRLMYTAMKYATNSTAIKPILQLFITLFPIGKRNSTLTDYSEIIIIRLFFPCFLKFPTVCFKQIVLVWLQQDLIMNNNGKIDQFCHERFYLGMLMSTYYLYFTNNYEIGDFRLDTAYEDYQLNSSSKQQSNHHSNNSQPLNTTTTSRSSTMMSTNSSSSNRNSIEETIQIIQIIILRYLSVSHNLFIDNSLFSDKYSPNKFIDPVFNASNALDKLSNMSANFQSTIDPILLNTYKLLLESTLFPNYDLALKSKILTFGLLSISKPVCLSSYTALITNAPIECMHSVLQQLVKKLPLFSHQMRHLLLDALDRPGLVKLICDILLVVHLKSTNSLESIIVPLQHYSGLYMLSHDPILFSSAQLIHKTLTTLGISCSTSQTRASLYLYIRELNNYTLVDDILNATEICLNEINMSIENATLIWAPRMNVDAKFMDDLECYFIYLLASMNSTNVHKLAHLIRYAMNMSYPPCRTLILDVFKFNSPSDLLLNEFYSDLEKLFSEFKKKIKPKTIEWITLISILVPQRTITSKLEEELLPVLFDYVTSDAMDSETLQLRILTLKIAMYNPPVSNKMDDVKQWTGYYHRMKQDTLSSINIPKYLLEIQDLSILYLLKYMTSWTALANFADLVLDDPTTGPQRQLAVQTAMLSMCKQNQHFEDLIEKTFSIKNKKSTHYALILMLANNPPNLPSLCILRLLNQRIFPKQNRIAAINATNSINPTFVVSELFNRLQTSHPDYHDCLFQVLIELLRSMSIDKQTVQELIYLTYTRQEDMYKYIEDMWASWTYKETLSKIEMTVLVIQEMRLQIKQISFIVFSQQILALLYKINKIEYLQVVMNGFTWEHVIAQKSTHHDNLLRFTIEEETIKGPISIGLLNYCDIVILLNDEIDQPHCIYLLQFGLMHYSHAPLKKYCLDVLEKVTAILNLPFYRFTDPIEYLLFLVPQLQDDFKIKIVDEIIQWLSSCPIVKFHITSLKVLQILHPKLENYIFLELINLLQKTLQDQLEETLLLKKEVYDTISFLLRDKQFGRADKSFALFIVNILQYCPEDDVGFSTFQRVSKLFLQLFNKALQSIESDLSDEDLIDLLTRFTCRYFQSSYSAVDYFTFIDEFITLYYPIRKNEIMLSFLFIGLLKLRQEFTLECAMSCQSLTVLQGQFSKFFSIFCKKKLKDLNDLLTQCSSLVNSIHLDDFHSEFSKMIYSDFESNPSFQMVQFICKYNEQRMTENSSVFMSPDSWLTEFKFEESILQSLMGLYNSVSKYKSCLPFTGVPLTKQNSIVLYNDSLKNFLIKWKPDFQVKNTLRFSYEQLVHESLETSKKASTVLVEENHTRLDFPSASSLAVYETMSGSSNSSIDVSMLNLDHTSPIEAIIEYEEEEKTKTTISSKHRKSKSMAPSISSKSSSAKKTVDTSNGTPLGSALSIESKPDTELAPLPLHLTIIEAPSMQTSVHHSIDSIASELKKPGLLENVKESFHLLKEKLELKLNESTDKQDTKLPKDHPLMESPIDFNFDSPLPKDQPHLLKELSNVAELVEPAFDVLNESKQPFKEFIEGVVLSVVQDPVAEPKVLNTLPESTNTPLDRVSVTDNDSIISGNEIEDTIMKLPMRKKSRLILEMNSVCTENYLQKNMDQYKSSISNTLKLDLEDIESIELHQNFEDANTKIRVELRADEDVDLKSMESEISASIRNGSLVIPVISNQISLELKTMSIKTSESRKTDSTKSDQVGKRKANSRPSVKSLFQ